jgi:prefoldin subunit 5
MATGFSLGYGYLFRSLEENVEFLLARINLISTIIDNYSKPLRVYYSSNFRLRSRIYELQQKMMDVVQFRQDLAVAIAGGYRLAHLVKKPEPKPQPKTEENKTPKSALQSILDTIGDIVKLKWISDKEKEKKESEKHKVTHNMSDVDLTYFSEKSEQITQLNEQLRELKLKQEKLDADELDFARTQGVWQSIKDQISNAEQKRSYMANMITKTKQGIAVEVEKLERLKTEEITLLTEGYYTGLWFKDIDKSTDKKLLWQ